MREILFRAKRIDDAGILYVPKYLRTINKTSFHYFGCIDKWQDMGASGIITYSYEVIGNKYDDPELLIK